MSANDSEGDYLEVRVEVTRMRWTADGPRRVRGTQQVTAVRQVPVRVMQAARVVAPLTMALRVASDDVLRLVDGRQVGQDVDPLWLLDGRATRAL